MKQCIGQRVRLGEILRPPRHTGDRMIGWQRRDRRAEVAQLCRRCADPEQAAVLLHHVDAGAPICRIDHQMHRAVGQKDIAQCPKAGIRVRQVMEHARTDDLIENLAELPDLFDRQPMEIEVLQAVFSLKIAGITQAGFADVDSRHASIRFAQSMDGTLGGSAAGDQNRSISPGFSVGHSRRDNARRRSGLR